MPMKKINLIVMVILALLSFSFSASAQEESVGKMPHLIVFYSPSCHKCIQVKNKLIPQIEERFKNKISIEYRDIGNIENYRLLLSLREKYHPNFHDTVPVIYFEGNLLSSQGPLKENLEALINKSLGITQKTHEALPVIDLLTHFKSFRLLTIVSAGLIDGINPCAFTVIVFFISFLVLQGYKKRELIITSTAFIFAVFLTYIFIGIGIFSFLYSLNSFWLVARIFNIAIGFFCIILGAFALYDFFKFKKTGSSEGLTLQLPQAVKNQIHKLIGLHYRKSKDQPQKLSIFSLVLSALITGFLVSILEAVCTGQVYLPTITFILKTAPLKLHALGFLMLYNLMFILPLAVIFLLALWGVTSEQFAKILKKNLLSIKIVMAVLFFALGIFLIWRA
jgi:cytochrome c biogenesis protein CcdA